MEHRLEIDRKNWDIFFSFLRKDYDQRDHYDDYSPRRNMSFLHLLSSFPPCPLPSTLQPESLKSIKIYSEHVTWLHSQSLDFI